MTTKSEEPLMREVISALSELIDTAENIEDIEAMEQILIIFSRRFMHESTLHRARLDFGTQLY